MDTSYTPVQWEYRELILDEIAKNTSGKIFYFTEDISIDDETGRIMNLEEVEGEGLFIQLDTKNKIRIDRIITVFGKPGPAYDKYNALGNTCMDCSGGYEP